MPRSHFFASDGGFLVVLSLQFFAVGSIWAQHVQLDLSFAPVVTDHRAVGRFLALAPDGRILINGARERYLPDGARDPSYVLAAGLDPIVRAVVAADGRIIALTRSPDRHRLVRLRPDGSLDAMLDVTLAIGADKFFRLPDGKFLLLGQNAIFSSGTTTRYSLARLNADGSLDPGFDTGFGPQLTQGGTASGLIWSVAPQADGKILIGGFFTAFDGTPRNNVVRLNANGTVDPAFVPATLTSATGSAPHVVALPGGKALVFERSTTNRLIRLKADGSLDAVLGSLASAGQFNGSVVQPDGRVLLGGQFTAYNNVPRLNLLRLNADGSLDLTFEASASAPEIVDGFALQPDGRIFVSALDVTSTLPSDGFVVRLKADGSLDPSFMPGTGRRPGALLTTRHADGRVALGGTFTTVNGIARLGLARLLANGAIDLGFAPVATSPMPLTALVALPDGGMVVAGSFNSIAGVPRSGLARFTHTGALDGTFAPTLNIGATIAAVLAPPDGRLVIAGNFSTVNGLARPNLAVLLPNGSTDASFTATAGLNGNVTALAPRAGGGFFLAGNFSSVEGRRRNGIAAYTATGALDLVFAPTQLATTETITALTGLPDGGVVIASPKAPNNTIRAHLRRLRNTGEIDPSYVFPFEVNATFTSLATDTQGRVLAAYSAVETFENSQGPPRYYVQRFSTNGAWDPDFNVGTGPSGPVSSLDLAADGSILVAGAFDRFDDLPFGAVIRLNPDQPAANTAPILFDISTRGETAPGVNVLTAGFVIGGTTPKTVLLRAVGPGLAAFGLLSALPDPNLSLFRTDGTQITSNDNWMGANPLRPIASASDAGFHVAQATSRIGTFPLQSLDSALLVTLSPGSYTAQVRGGGTNTTGVTLIEVYDANALPGDRRLLNISTRGTAGAVDRTLIAGFVIRGRTPKRVLIRAIGPGLGAFNVANALADPTLTLANSAGATIATDDDWSRSANKAEVVAATANVGAFALADPSNDAVLLLTLPPGSYTALVNGANNTTGVALVEVYEVP